MKERFQTIPGILRRQILIRFAGSGLGIGMVLLVLIYRGSPRYLIPGFAIVLIFLTAAVTLTDRCADGRYVVIEGVCEQIEYTGLRKRPKSLQIRHNDKTVRIMGHLHKLRSLRPGDQVEVYLADSTPVYEHDGVYLITQILAIRKER